MLKLQLDVDIETTIRFTYQGSKKKTDYPIIQDKLHVISIYKLIPTCTDRQIVTHNTRIQSTVTITTFG